MNFYFCETCGKRVTDVDIMRKDALDKQARGVYCKACAVGITTEEFDAIQLPTEAPSMAIEPDAPPPVAPPALPPGAGAGAGAGARTNIAPSSGARRAVSPSSHSPAAGLKTLRPDPARKQMSKTAAQTGITEARARTAAVGPASRTPLIAGLAMVVIVGGALILFTRSGTPPTSQPADESAAPRTAEAREAPAPAPSAPNPAKTVTATRGASTPNVSPSAIPSPASTSTPTPTLEDRAGAAFNTLKKALSKIDPEKKEQQIALIEAFLKDYGESDLGPRVRVMLSNARKPPEPANLVASAEPPAPAPELNAPVPAGGRELFNKKDLTGWTLRANDGSCQVENGEMVFSGDKTGSAITPMPAKDYTLIVEIFLEDAGGNYVEIQTRAGTAYLDRSMSGEWLTIQLTVKGKKLEAKMLKGHGNALKSDTAELPDHFRFHTMNGGKKRVRSVRLMEIAP